MNITTPLNPFFPDAETYGKRFDEAFDQKNVPTIQTLISECESIVEANFSPAYAPLLYYLGNAYSELYFLLPEYKIDSTCEKILYYYRSCLELLSSPELQDYQSNPRFLYLQLPLLTNYGNMLDICSRKLAALK